jgi:hypothetical protein
MTQPYIFLAQRPRKVVANEGTRMITNFERSINPIRIPKKKKKRKKKTVVAHSKVKRHSKVDIDEEQNEAYG